MSDPAFSTTPQLVGSDEKTLPVVIYVLYLLGFITGGLTTVIGVIMAYVLKGGAGPLAYSHYVFQIRTFWLALLWLMLAAVVFGVGLPLAFILIGIPLLVLAKLIGLATAVWYAVRSIIGLISASRAEPYARPRAWII